MSIHEGHPIDLAYEILLKKKTESTQFSFSEFSDLAKAILYVLEKKREWKK